MIHSKRSLLLAGLLLIGSSAVAYADPCTDLVSQAESGLAQQGLDPASKSELETLLGVGRSGDVSACAQAATGSMSSPPHGEGRKCQKTLNSV
jgi:hypothetical protein